MGWKTKNFTLEEFTRSTTADRLKIDNTPTKEVEKNLFILASQVLEPARAIVGKPIVITSGYRCIALNKAVGGVNSSYHTKGLAADIRIRTKQEADNLAAAILRQTLTDEILLEHSKTSVWMHVQIRLSGARHYLNMNYRA